MTVLFGGRYTPPGDASTLRAASAAIMDDHVHGKESDTPEWEFWIKLAALLSDVAGGYDTQVADDPESASLYDQEIQVAVSYLRMTGREPTRHTSPEVGTE